MAGPRRSPPPLRGVAPVAAGAEGASGGARWSIGLPLAKPGSAPTIGCDFGAVAAWRAAAATAPACARARDTERKFGVPAGCDQVLASTSVRFRAILRRTPTGDLTCRYHVGPLSP